MTKRVRKNTHREIIDRLEGPQDSEAMAEIVYGDENNPYERYSTGERNLELPPGPPKDPA